MEGNLSSEENLTQTYTVVSSIWKLRRAIDNVVASGQDFVVVKGIPSIHENSDHIQIMGSFSA